MLSPQLLLLVVVLILVMVLVIAGTGGACLYSGAGESNLRSDNRRSSAATKYDLLPAGSPPHTHSAILGEAGVGRSSYDQGHSHSIVDYLDTGIATGTAPPHHHELQ